VDQRIAAVTALERSMYANHLGHKRPTVRVGNMAEEVDATRHYQQILSDLNAAIAKEQVSATARAQFVDRMSGVDTLSIIEGFLQVTEMGSLKKLLKKQSGSSQKWIPKNKPHKEVEDLLDVTKDEPNFEGLRERKKSADGYGTYQSGEICMCDRTSHQCEYYMFTYTNSSVHLWYRIVFCTVYSIVAQPYITSFFFNIKIATCY
jgi:hypothetical protein